MKNNVLLTLLILSFPVLHGQTPFIQSFSNLTALNTTQISDFNRIAQYGYLSNPTLVQVNPLINGLNTNGNLQIGSNLVGSQECQNLEYKTVVSRYIDESNYYYYGVLAEGTTSNCSCKSGEIMLQSDGGKKFGYYVVDDAKYEILAIDQTYSLLAKVNSSYFATTAECGQTGNSNQNAVSNPGQADQVADYRSGPCMISVLFLYTDAAAAKFKPQGIYQMALGGINSTNQAFFNSHISNVRTKMAAVLPLAGFVENSENIINDIVAFEETALVLQLRNNYQADVVCLITDGNYVNFAGFSGVMPAPGGGLLSNLGAPMFNLAYMIVEGSSFNSRFTFSHEFGHVMGCRHQTNATFTDNNADDAGTVEHGFNWVEGNWPCRRSRSSIMHVYTDVFPRVLNYSNPFVERHGGVTGTTATENNAGWINGSSGCTVADYYADPIPVQLTAIIEGEEFLCQPNVGHYTALPSVQGSYMYQWHKSTNGLNWGQPIGTTQSIDINSANFQIGQTVFLRVKVINAQNEQAFGFFEITIGDPSDDLCPRSNDIGKPNHGVVISPNPTSTELNIQFQVVENQSEALIELFSLDGLKTLEIKKTLPKGEHLIPIPMSNFAPGMFIVKLKVGSKFYSQSIIKS